MKSLRKKTQNECAAMKMYAHKQVRFNNVTFASKRRRLNIQTTAALRNLNIKTRITFLCLYQVSTIALHPNTCYVSIYFLNYCHQRIPFVIETDPLWILWITGSNTSCLDGTNSY
jgi:hypothetical protein